MTSEQDDERIAEILAEYQESRERGAAADPEEVLRANPDLADALATHFAAQALFDDLSGRAATSVPGAPAALGEFRVVREIGRGGMGVVYEAEQSTMRRRVALKVLFPSVTSSRRAVERFQREARAAGRLHHTNIVPVYSMGEERGVWFYAMELVTGRPLDAVIEDVRRLGRSARAGGRRGPAPSAFGTDPGADPHFERVAATFAGVAEGLDAAHAAGIVHRDVKPSNLVLDVDGTLRLMDFGLARMADEAVATRTGEIVGTPSYMSPEQAGGAALDARTDVYSLGATLYETLTLRAPFRSGPVPKVLAAIRGRDPVRPRRLDPRIPRDLETIVLKAMEKEPARRYATSADLARDLHAFAAGGAIRARRVTAVERAWRSARRHKLVTSLAAAASALAAALVVLGVHAAHEAEHRRLHDYQRLCVLAAEQFASADVSSDVGHPAFAESDARALLTAAIELDPARPDAWLWRALIPSVGADVRLADVDAAATRGLSERTRRLARAHVLGTADRAADAEAERRLAGPPPAARTGLDAYFEGHLALLRGRPTEAIGPLGDALASAPPGSLLQTLARRSRAAAREAAGDLPGAIDDLASLRGGAGEPGPGPRIRIARLWARLGQADRSASVQEELLAEWRASRSPEAWRSLTQSLINSGLHDFADRATSAALAAFPDDPGLLHDRGAVLFQAGRPADALPFARRAAELRPERASWLSSVGRILVHLGRYDEAEGVLRRAVGLDPSSVPVRLDLAALHRGVGRWDAALAEVRHTLELDATSHAALEGLAVTLAGPPPDSMLFLDVRGARTGLQPGLHRPAEALEAADRALALHPSCAGCHFVRAQALRVLGREEEALAAIDRAVESDPEEPNAWVLRATTLSALGRLDEALASIDRAIGLDAARPRGYLSVRADLLLRLGRADDAAAQWRRIEESLPGDALAASTHGEALLGMARFADALAAYDRALAIDGARLPSRIGRSNALARLGRIDEALAELDRVLAADPHSAMARCNRASLLASRGRLDESLAEFVRARDEDSTLWQAFEGEGTVLVRQGRFADALRAFDAGLALDPPGCGLLLSRAGALQGLGRIPEALEMVERAARIDPKLGYAQRYVGIYLMALHRRDEALRAFVRAVDLDPKDGISRNYVAWDLATRADHTTRDPDRAVALAREAVALDPASVYFPNTLGVALCAAGEWEEAGEVLARSMALRGGGDAYDWFPAAIVAKRLGDEGKARECFDKAVAWMSGNDPGDPGLTALRRDAERAVGVGDAAQEAGDGAK